MASPQPRTPGHRTPLPGPPDQRSHHERGSDTGPAPTPHQAHGKPHGGSSTPPARSGPQSSGQMVHRKHLLLTHADKLTDPPPGNTCSVSSITMPCMTQTSTNPLRAPHRAPRLHPQVSKAPPQRPETRLAPRSHPAPPSPAEPSQGQPFIDVDAQDPGSPSSPPPRTRDTPPSHRPPSATPTSLRATLQDRAPDTPWAGTAYKRTGPSSPSKPSGT